MTHYPLSGLALLLVATAQAHASPEVCRQLDRVERLLDQHNLGKDNILQLRQKLCPARRRARPATCMPLAVQTYKAVGNNPSDALRYGERYCKQGLSARCLDLAFRIHKTAGNNPADALRYGERYCRQGLSARCLDLAFRIHKTAGNNPADALRYTKRYCQQGLSARCLARAFQTYKRGKNTADALRYAKRYCKESGATPSR